VLSAKLEGILNKMDTAKLLSVIETTLLRRGNGKDIPVRIITQYWDTEGNLLAEVDPMPQPQEDQAEKYSPVIRALIEWQHDIKELMRQRKWSDSSFDFLFEDEVATRTTLTVLNRIMSGELPPRGGR
jgi:hypothetical protein